MLRRDDLYLADIIEAARAIRSFLDSLESQDRRAFIDDDLTRSAVLQKLSVIGEAAARVSEETREAYPDIPWRQARGMRNLLVHAYFSVDWDIIWTTASESVPMLAEQVSVVLSSEEGSPT